jgi:hypothetical protein
MPLPTFKSSDYPELHVLNFGYEIEGGFEYEFADRDDDGEYCNEHFRHDGSVSVNDDELEDGEIASPKFRVDRRLQFRQFVGENMPSETNNSCGIHVHVSMNNALAYQKCCDVDFYKLFRKTVWRFMHNGLFSAKTVREFESRYNGRHSTYCRDGFNPDHSINSGFRDFQTESANFQAGRYNCINFEAFRKYKTIECRMFPSSEDKDEVIAMVEFWIEFCNNYLQNVTPYERGNFETVEVESVDTDTTEEVLICV